MYFVAEVAKAVRHRQQINQIPNWMGIPRWKRGTERIEHHISSNIIIQETWGDPKRGQPLTLKS